MYKVRVRGLYATALAKILLDAGAELVDLSKQLSERFSLPQRSEEPPHVTVKTSDEDTSTLVIIGNSDAVDFVLEELISRIPFALYRYSSLGPYTTIVARVLGEEGGKCIVEIPDGKAVLVDSECTPGNKVVCHVVRAALQRNDMLVLRPGLAVLSDTLVLIDDGRSRVTFSEHIRSSERRAELLMMSQSITREGISIHWRSAARSAPLDTLSRDLELCKRKLEDLKKKVNEVSEPAIVSYGEAIALVILTRPSKEYLDDVRSQVLGTVPYHHILKSCQYPQVAVDVLDIVSGYVNRNEMRFAITKYIESELSKLSTVRIKHLKPDGEVVTIGPMYIERVEELPLLGTSIIGKRVVRSPGVYDGLGVAKEPGDVITTVIPINEWFVIHTYMSSNGKEKGVYININTPPEVCVPLSEVRYLDLYVDIAVVGDEVKVVDEDQLREAAEKSVVDRDLEFMAMEKVKEVLSKLKELLSVVRGIAVPSPPSPQPSAPSSQ